MEPSPDRILEVGYGFTGAAVLLSASELGLFTELAKGPLDAEALAARLGIHPRGARDFFDALVALGLLERDGGRYRNTPETDHHLDRGKRSYVGGRLDHWRDLYRVWADLTEALRTGRPQRGQAGGRDLFEDLYADVERRRVFLAGMAGGSLPIAKAIARRFPWERYRTFADIGTAVGVLPVEVALAHGHLDGLGFDLPAIGPMFEEYVASFGLEPRLRFVAGNFFSDPLPEADVLVMGRVLHDWDLEQKRMLLRKAHAALRPGGALVVYEAIIDDERRRHAPGLLVSLTMLLMTEGGSDFTGAECRRWMAEAGFSESYVEPLTSWESMVVGIR